MSVGETRVRILVHGRVQGVGYRAWTEREARARGLAGWVRNRRDGTVEALLCGPAEQVDAMLSACRRGPAGASVTGLDTMAADGAEEAPATDPSAFSVAPTA